MARNDDAPENFRDPHGFDGRKFLRLQLRRAARAQLSRAHKDKQWRLRRAAKLTRFLRRFRPGKQKMRLKGFSLAVLLVSLAACDRGPAAPAETATSKASNPEFGERWQYPRERITKDGKRVIVYAPQIRTWDKFEHFTAQVAVEFPESAEDARYGVIDLSGDTIVDRKARLVKVPHPKVDRVTFSGGTGAQEHEDRIRATVESEPLEMPLDVFLYYLADGVLESPPPAGFNDKPPPIYVVESPAFLLFINGKEVATVIGDTGLELISNANFPLFRDTRSGKYYLLSGDHRYSAAKLAGPWGPIADLPTAFRKIPARGEYTSIAAVVATTPKPGAAPRIIPTFEPAEIVVLDGKPNGREIAGTGGLESITNTASPLFRLADTLLCGGPLVLDGKPGGGAGDSRCRCRMHSRDS
jgi:hypothetical protein